MMDASELLDDDEDVEDEEDVEDDETEALEEHVITSKSYMHNTLACVQILLVGLMTNSSIVLCTIPADRSCVGACRL